MRRSHVKAAFDVATFRIYTLPMEFTWSEAKRNLNLKNHGLELGLLAGIPVSIVHTESEHEIRIISFRKATQRETQIYFDEIKN